MPLETVQDYISQTRVILLDTIEPYRYETPELVDALNRGIMEARRLRPDLLMGTFRSAFPSYTPASMSDVVDMDIQYRMALIYYIAGQAQLRDEEETTDARASGFINKFTSQMLNIQA